MSPKGLGRRPKPRAALLVEPLEEAEQGPDLAVLADPRQPAAALVDLIDQGQIAMSALPLDLVHTDGFDPREILLSYCQMLVTPLSGGVLEARLEVHPVGPDVEVALGLEIAALPALQLAPPELLETGHRRGGKPWRFRA